MKKVLILVMALCMGLTASTWAQKNQVLYERWNTPSASTIPVVKQLVVDGVEADVTAYLDSFLQGDVGLGGFVSRISGWLVPPVDGDYTFYVAGDDNCDLMLSTDDDPANAVTICTVNSWTGVREWSKEANQKSAVITLVAGQAYFIDAYHQEGGGGDSIAAGWTGPDPVPATIANGSGEIPGAYLYAYNPMMPGAPDPADDATSVNQMLAELKFAAPITPGSTWNAYFGTDPNTWTQVLTDSDLTTIDISGETLAFDTEYFWRVDIIEVNEVTQVENAIAGDLWSFTTQPAIPEITAALPASFVIGEGNTGSISVAYSSVSEVSSIVWKKDGAVIATGDGEFTTLTIENASAADLGNYTVEITNAAGPASSGPAAMILGKEVAYWPFDGDGNDYSGNENHNDDYAGGTQVAYEADGATALTGGHISFNGNNMSYVSSGTWDPAAQTGQMSVAFWARFDDTGGRWQGICGQRNSWSSTNMSWQVEIDNNNNMGGFSRNGSGHNNVRHNFVGGEWAHWVTSFDGSTARIYINGQLIGQYGFSLGGNRNANWAVGSCNVGTIGGGAGNMYTGDVDEFHVYDYGITNAEVKQLYANETGMPVCLEAPAYDYDGDCIVGLGDLGMMLSEWTECNLYPTELCD